MMAWSSCQFDCGMSCLPFFWDPRSPNTLQISKNQRKREENSRIQGNITRNHFFNQHFHPQKSAWDDILYHFFSAQRSKKRSPNGNKNQTNKRTSVWVPHPVKVKHPLTKIPSVSLETGELSSLSHPIQEPHSRVGICEAKVGICLYIVLLTKVFSGVNDPVW